MDKLDLSIFKKTKPASSYLDRILIDQSFLAYLKAKGLTDSIIKTYQYELYLILQEKRECCDKCQGKKCLKETFKYLVTNLSLIDQNTLSFTLFPCQYNQNASSYYRVFETNRELLLIDKHNITNLDQITGRNEVLKYFVNLKKGTKANLYLTGEKGSGKTYITIALLNTILGKNDSMIKEAAVIDYSKTLKSLDQQRFEINLESKMNDLAQVPLLVIDNFLKNGITSFLRDTILIPLLEKRNGLKNPTIFISKYPLLDIPALVGNIKKGRELLSVIKNNQTRVVDLGLSIY